MLLDLVLLLHSVLVNEALGQSGYLVKSRGLVVS